MSNSEPNVIIIDDNIFYEIEQLFDERVKELQKQKNEWCLLKFILIIPLFSILFYFFLNFKF